VNEEGFREVLVVAEGWKEDKLSWTACLGHLKERGLKGARLFVSDKCLGLVESLGEFHKRCRSGARFPLKEMKLADGAALVLSGIDETLYYYAFPSERWRCLRTNNPLERLLRELRQERGRWVRFLLASRR
jgi:putative transposase